MTIFRMLDFIRVDYELFKHNSIIILAYIVGLPIECILYCNEPYLRQTVVWQIQTIDQEKVQGNPFIVIKKVSGVSGMRGIFQDQ